MKKNYLTKLCGVFILGLMLVSCASARLAYYDNETVKNLTYLKVDVKGVYKQYSEFKINAEEVIREVAAIDLTFDKVLEYEKAKEANSETVKQIEIIQKMFARHFQERISEQKIWPGEFMQMKLKNIQDAFDIAIKTEMSKNMKGNWL